jgi:hypothetical protein
VIIEDWRCDYKANRPHSAHGELTPTEFALQRTMTHQPQSRIATGPPNGSPSRSPYFRIPDSGIVIQLQRSVMHCAAMDVR